MARLNRGLYMNGANADPRKVFGQAGDVYGAFESGQDPLANRVQEVQAVARNIHLTRGR